MTMRAIQLTIDEDLLADLDADLEVKRRGRSAVIRQLAAEYLEARRRKAVTARYRKAYGKEKGLADEFVGWEGEGVWPPR